MLNRKKLEASLQRISVSTYTQQWKDGFLQPGDMVACRRKGLIVNPILRLAQTVALNDFYDIDLKDDWFWAGFTHVRCIDFKRPQFSETTSPKARFLDFHDSTGYPLLILRPNVKSSVALNVSKRMHSIAEQGLDYPERELVANTRLLRKFLIKRLGHKRFDKIFTSKDTSVCSGTYVTCLILEGPKEKTVLELKKHRTTSWGPARLALVGKPLFSVIEYVELSNES